MRLVLLSDTHGQHARLTGDLAVPNGDVLIHAGDCTARGGLDEYTAFLSWFGSLRHAHKVFVPGNHDGLFQGHRRDFLRSYAERHGVHILIDQALALAVDDGRPALQLWGSPWTPPFGDWHFMADEDRLESLYDAMPADLDVLITHGPPRGILDRNHHGHPCGSRALLEAVAAKPPRVHVFGHIHEGGGEVRSRDGVTFVNASAHDERYQLVHPPITLDLPA
ncbi:MAG TPA: metallophosphatase domain-containing protein [Rubricoccaceae bacterium]